MPPIAHPFPLQLVAALLLLAVLIGAFLWRRNRMPQTLIKYRGVYSNSFAIVGELFSLSLLISVPTAVAYGGPGAFLSFIAAFLGLSLGYTVFAEPLHRSVSPALIDALGRNSRDTNLRHIIGTYIALVAGLLIAAQVTLAGILLEPWWDDLINLGAHVRGRNPVILVVILPTLAIPMSAIGAGATRRLQILKAAAGTLLAVLLTIGVLHRGLTTTPQKYNPAFHLPNTIPMLDDTYLVTHGLSLTTPPFSAGTSQFVELRDTDGNTSCWKYITIAGWSRLNMPAVQVQSRDGRLDSLGIRPAKNSATTDFPIGNVASLPPGYNIPGQPSITSTGTLWPREYLYNFQLSTITLWKEEPPFATPDGSSRFIVDPVELPGTQLLQPFPRALFADLPPTSPASVTDDGETDWRELFHILLMTLLGTAMLPNLLQRFLTIAPTPSAKASRILASLLIALLGFSTLFIGLGAMTSGVLAPFEPLSAIERYTATFGALPAILFTLFIAIAAIGSSAALMTTITPLIPPRFRKSTTDDMKSRFVAGLPLIAAIVILSLLADWVNWQFLLYAGLNLAAAAFPSFALHLRWKHSTSTATVSSLCVAGVGTLIALALSPSALTLIHHASSDAIGPTNAPGLFIAMLAAVVHFAIAFIANQKK